jgi:hypothetical protein
MVLVTMWITRNAKALPSHQTHLALPYKQPSKVRYTYKVWTTYRFLWISLRYEASVAQAGEQRSPVASKVRSVVEVLSLRKAQIAGSTIQ